MNIRHGLRRVLAILLIFGTLAACNSGASGGPDLVAAVNSVPGATSAPSTPPSPDPLEAADRTSYVTGDVDSVADAIRSAAGEPSDSVIEDGVVHYLYRSGTVIIADVGDSTGIGLSDNDRARRRVPVLVGRSGWNNRVDDFRSSSSGSNSGNGFRGGGSGSGK